MAAAIKYQQLIHKRFAKEQAKKESAGDYYTELYKTILAERPEAAALLQMPKKPENLLSPELTAVVKGNEELCKYFFLVKAKEVPFSDKADSFNTAPAFTSAETVKMYADTLDNARCLLEEETDDNFKQIHKGVIKALEDYFSLCAEAVLNEYYGEDYAKFVKEETKREEKVQKDRSGKREETVAAKKAAE